MKTLMLTICRIIAMLLLGGGCVYAGFQRFVTVEGQWETLTTLLGAFALIAVGCALIAPTVAGVLARPWGRIYFPGHQLASTQRVFQKPLLLQRQKRFKEAIAEYRRIARKVRRPVNPYMAMIEIAMREMKNAELGKALLAEGKKTIRLKRDHKFLEEKYRLEQRILGRDRENYVPKILLDTDVDELEVRLERELKEKRKLLASADQGPVKS
ncbi:hypothetical protein BVY04_04945 [bacterium M21]|nr:hypothetical protein BVY04_04945 [bacterium M21]